MQQHEQQPVLGDTGDARPERPATAEQVRALSHAELRRLLLQLLGRCGVINASTRPVYEEKALRALGIASGADAAGRPPGIGAAAATPTSAPAATPAAVPVDTFLVHVDGSPVPVRCSGFKEVQLVLKQAPGARFTKLPRQSDALPAEHLAAESFLAAAASARGAGNGDAPSSDTALAGGRDPGDLRRLEFMKAIGQGDVDACRRMLRETPRLLVSRQNRPLVLHGVRAARRTRWTAVWHAHDGRCRGYESRRCILPWKWAASPCARLS